VSPGLGLSGEMVSCEVELLPEQTIRTLASKIKVKDRKMIFHFVSFQFNGLLSQITEDFTNGQTGDKAAFDCYLMDLSHFSGPGRARGQSNPDNCLKRQASRPQAGFIIAGLIADFSSQFNGAFFDCWF